MSELNGVDANRLVNCPKCQGDGFFVVAGAMGPTGAPEQEQEPCGLCNTYGKIEITSYDEWCKIQSQNNEPTRSRGQYSRNP